MLSCNRVRDPAFTVRTVCGVAGPSANITILKPCTLPGLSSNRALDIEQNSANSADEAAGSR